MSACGSFDGDSGTSGAGGSRASPVDAYRKEDSEGGGDACQVRNSARGCARLFTAGSAVGGAFTFESLYVECERSSAGVSVRMRNLPDSSATFRLDATVVGASGASGLFACQGAEAGEGSSLAKGSCLISVQVHNDLFSASPSGRCFLELRKGKPLAGRLSCDGLLYGEETFTIGERSTFRCQESVR